MKKTCNECHGTGQTRYFKGESRFILSQEECPACCGMGFVETCDDQEDEGGEESDPQGSAQ